MSENTDGKIIHSEVEVSIDPNCTTAFMTISEPAGGGLDVTPEKAMAAIRAKGIAFGVIESAVSEAVYFKKESTFKPIEDENGNVDYKNLGLVRNIYHGTPIAKITPPTEGTPGTDIMGKPVAQKHGVRLNSAWARELSL